MGNLQTDMKLGDLLPVFRTPILDGTAIVPLTGASVLLLVTRPDGTPLSKSMNIEDAVNGIVNYPWVNGDLPTVGDYFFEVQVTFANGKKQTFPAKGHGIISVHEDLD
jgi:hypothetical protein